MRKYGDKTKLVWSFNIYNAVSALNTNHNTRHVNTNCNLFNEYEVLVYYVPLYASYMLHSALCSEYATKWALIKNKNQGESYITE